jgi:single-strand DNA-binding protein
MLNKVMIIGHVGQEPEVRYTGNATNGTKVATLRVATSEKYKDKDGNVKEQTEWHSIVCWRQLADVVEKYVKKGTQLYVEGKLVTRSWEDQNGGKKYSTDIVAQTLQLLGKKEGAQPQRDPAIAGAQQMQRPQSTPLPTIDPSDNPEDDLPF